jgi:hypothetical protein
MHWIRERDESGFSRVSGVRGVRWERRIQNPGVRIQKVRFFVFSLPIGIVVVFDSSAFEAFSTTIPSHTPEPAEPAHT